jgi:hypothetical protein
MREMSNIQKYWLENLKGNLVADMHDIKVDHEGEDWIKVARKGPRVKVL